MLTEDKIEELVELRKLGTQGKWHYNGNEIVSLENTRVGIAGAMNDYDSLLIVEAVNAIDQIRTLQQQNKQLVEAVKQIIETRGYDDSLWTTEWKYETVIDIANKAIQGDKS